MTITIQLTEEEIRVAIINYLYSIGQIDDSMIPTTIYPCSGSFTFTNEKEEEWLS